MSVTIITNDLETGDKIKITGENSKVLYNGPRAISAKDLAFVLEHIIGKYVDVVMENDDAFESF
jgi:hypothetical protein